MGDGRFAKGTARPMWLILGLLACSSGTQVIPMEEEPSFTEFDAWTPLAPLPLAVRSAAVATDGSRLYVVGGSMQAGRAATLQIMDIQSETWSYGTSLPEPTDWGSASWVDGALHFMGGVTNNAKATTQHYVYDLASAEWIPAKPLPVPIAGTAGLADGSAIYVFAGNSGGSPAYTAQTYVYSVAADAWSLGAPVPGERINWAGTFLTDRFYLVGGGIDGLDTSSDMLAYHPATNSWTPLRSIPLAREAHGVASSLGLVCAVGGRLAASGNFNTPYSDVSCYDPSTDGWIPAPPLPRARQEVAAVTVDGMIIAVGGADDDGVPVTDVTVLRLK